MTTPTPHRRPWPTLTSRHLSLMLLLAATAVLPACQSGAPAAKPRLATADARRQFAAQYLRDADIVIEFRSWDDIRISRPAVRRGEDLRQLNGDGLVSALRLTRPNSGLAAVRFDHRYNDNHTRRHAPSEYPDIKAIEERVHSAGYGQVVFVSTGAFGDVVVQR